ncbi:MAG: pyruvate dehydrogenase (acetyl-transferring) E1 component subunit alpha, partial [Desulfobulbaceae bacterium]|nr:pyruvate dehydrogenase (acetyl-transferring) E1 component subunit alpha [Desulfobulbaceae bacterium]
DAWRKRDPLPRFQNYLLKKQVVTENDIAGIEEEALQRIQEAVDNAEKQMKDMGNPLDMFDHLYAELPHSTQRQKEELRQRIYENSQEGQHG